MTEPFGSEDIRVLAKHEFAGQGAWTSMPAADKGSYGIIHSRLQEIIKQAVAKYGSRGAANKLGIDYSTLKRKSRKY